MDSFILSDEILPVNLRNQIKLPFVNAKVRKQLVHAICVDIQKKCSLQNLGRRDYRNLASKICSQYPGVRDLVENQELIGDGKQTVFRNIENTIDNLKRTPRKEAKARAAAAAHSVPENVISSEEVKKNQEAIENLKQKFVINIETVEEREEMRSLFAVQRRFILGELK